MKLIKSSTGTTLVMQMKAAQSMISRLVGLLNQKNLERDHGLWLIPCNSIHMLGMRFPIDAIYMDKDNRVIRLVENLKPNRFGPIVWDAHSVVEIPAGSIEKMALSIGEQLEIVA